MGKGVDHKHDDRCSIPGIHIMESETWYPQVVLWPPHAHRGMKLSYTSISTYTTNKPLLKTHMCIYINTYITPTTHT